MRRLQAGAVSFALLAEACIGGGAVRLTLARQEQVGIDSRVSGAVQCADRCKYAPDRFGCMESCPGRTITPGRCSESGSGPCASKVVQWSEDRAGDCDGSQDVAPDIVVVSCAVTKERSYADYVVVGGFVAVIALAGLFVLSLAGMQ